MQRHALLPRILQHHLGIVLMLYNGEQGGVLKGNCVACLL